MLSPKQLHGYQKKATLHQLYHDNSMLWLGCGLGKTPVTLTTIEHRIRAGQVKKVLVFGPVRVIHAVWEREARKWEHTKHLTFSIVGWPNEKKRKQGLANDADIYLCNYENMNWLATYLQHYYIDQGKPLPFDMVVYDEITRVKNSTSLRVAGGRKEKVKNRGKTNEVRTPYRVTGWRAMLPHIKYSTGLTGTPAANGYTDLHGQYLMIDGGQRLGEYITHYKEAYFTTGYDGWTQEVTEIGKQWIEHKIADITVKMDAEDYLELPDLIENDIVVDLSEKQMEKYREIEQDMYTQLDNGTEIEVFNRASVSNKCLQYSNGSVYTDPGNPTSPWEDIHDEKLQALDSIIEEAQGKTVLVGYTFRFDADRIMRRYKNLNPVNLTSVKPEDLTKVLADGNAGRIKLMIGHPKSLGHGVDGLNEFCKIIVWYGLPWSLEEYTQLIGRIAAGQRFTVPVTMHRILSRSTLDVAVLDALRRKEGDQNGLKNAIQRYRDGMTPLDGTEGFI